MVQVPMVSIVIVSWNCREYLARCLQSIQQFISYDHEIIVVDNASTDGTVDFVRTEFPAVKIIANGSDVGFATASNQGIRLARASFVALLNPDTELMMEPFLSMIAMAKSDSSIACVAPELLNSDRSHQPSVRQLPRLADQVIVMLKLRPFFKWLSVMRRYTREPKNTGQPIDVEQVMGAAMLIPRVALESVGLLDEAYPNWFEEVDWCARARRLGQRIMFDPRSKIIHYGGVSFQQILTIKKQRWFLAGLARYAKKNWSKKDQVVVKCVTPISLALSYLQLLIKPR